MIPSRHTQLRGCEITTMTEKPTPPPDYAAMAETMAALGRDLAARAAAEGDSALAAQGQRLLELAAAIRAGLPISK